MDNDEQILTMLQHMDKRFDGIDKRLDSIETRLDNVEGKLEENINVTKALVKASERMEGEIRGLELRTATVASVKAVDAKVDTLHKDIQASVDYLAKKWA